MGEMQIRDVRTWSFDGQASMDDLVTEAPEESLAALLRAYGLDGYGEAADLVVVRQGQHARLTGAATGESVIAPVHMETRDIDRYKAWIGTPDSTLGSVDAVVSHFDLPHRAWNGGGEFDPAELSDAERQDIERASWHYIFGYSPSVASYCEAIQRVYAPFELSVFAARKVVVEAGGELMLPEGVPAVLLLDELEIRDGGHLCFMSPFNLTVRHLRKVTA